MEDRDVLEVHQGAEGAGRAGCLAYKPGCRRPAGRGPYRKQWIQLTKQGRRGGAQGVEVRHVLLVQTVLPSDQSETGRLTGHVRSGEADRALVALNEELSPTIDGAHPC